MTSEKQLKAITSRVLIIGGGYIGTEVQKHLEYIGVDHILITRKDLDYSDTTSLGKFILNEGIGAVINCFGFTGKPNVDEAEGRKEECWDLNVVIPLEIATVCDVLSVRYIHISSGCIYSGYDKEFVEEDSPNFGLFDESSFYSKSKHAFETITSQIPMKLIRIRMPISDDINNPRNYLNKIMKYPNLVDFKNSKTYIPDLCGFVEVLLRMNNTDFWKDGRDIYNVVNPNPYNTRETVEHLNKMNYDGLWKELTPNWVDIKSLDLAAPRSNCVLNNDKASKLFKFHTEVEFMNMVCNYNNGIQAV